MRNIRSLYQQLLSDFRRQFSWLYEWGYTETSIVELTENRENQYAHLLIELSNAAIDRRIRFVFRPYSDHTTVDLVAFYISRKNESYRLDDFAKQNLEKIDFPVSLTAVEGSNFVDKSEIYLQTASVLMKEHLGEVLKGNNWIEVQFDWGDYK